MSSLDTGQNPERAVVAGKTTAGDLANQLPESPSSTMKTESSGQSRALEGSVPSSEMTQAVLGDTGSPETGPSRVLHATSGGLSPLVLKQNVSPSPANPKSPARHSRTSHVCDSKSLKRGKSGRDLLSDSLACQTKFLVLQYLHESMNEESVLHLSQSSFSNTSESEPRYMSYAEKLRQQWQVDRSQSSSPTVGTAHSKPKLKPRPKSGKSSNLVDKNYTSGKDVLPQTKPSRTRKHVSSNKPTGDLEGNRKPARLSRQNVLQKFDQGELMRSISESTENSDHGTPVSDADDELDGSYDSSQQGSVTSHSFREKVAQYYQQRHTKSECRRKSQPDCTNIYCDSSNFTCDKPAPCAIDNDTASSILSLDMINIEQQPVSPTTQFARVNDYLVQMSQTSVESIHQENSPSVELTDLDLDYLDAAAKELNTVQNDASQTCSDSEKRFDEAEQSVTFDESDLEAIDDQAEDEDQAEAACGGLSPDDNDPMGGRTSQRSRADPSQLRLDLGDPQDATLLIDAAHALQQDIEEEMFSLESEFEEALQTLQSDHCHPCTFNLSRSRSLSPEAAEAVRILARIGDEVQQRHFQDLDRAVSQLLLSSCAGFFTYENFRAAAPLVLDGEVDKWKQVATLLLYSQRVALHLSRFGRQGLNRVVDYTARMLVDTAADFIIRQGGWSPMLDPSSATSTSPDHPGPVLNPFLGPFTTTTSTPPNSQPPDNPENLSSQPSNPNLPEGSHVVNEAVPEAVNLNVPKDSQADHSQVITQEASGSVHDGGGNTEGTPIINPIVGPADNDPNMSANGRNDEDAGLHVASLGHEAFLLNPSSVRHDSQEGTCPLAFTSGDPGLAAIEGVHVFPLNSSVPSHVTHRPLSSSVPCQTITEELENLCLDSQIATKIVAEEAEDEKIEQNREGTEQTLPEATGAVDSEGPNSDVCRTASLNSSLLSRCAVVSLGVLAVSAAVVFRFVRKF